VEQILYGHKKAACLKTGIPASKQTATFAPLFAAFRLLFALILRAYMPAFIMQPLTAALFPYFVAFWLLFIGLFLKYGYI